ncbi:Argonaute family protein [Perilla frutescens var. hirtella]|uniref:Argonaute family protein n=1 Tax=Perilla frutescens var. hirtella TaxID=608512 RepID=A0AAD4JDB6_PERFH|nr:Argonaute family protein [Perilla frutescens var. hirtella]
MGLMLIYNYTITITFFENSIKHPYQLLKQNGRWDFFNKTKLFEPVKIERWAAVNFSASCNLRSICSDFSIYASMKGIHMNAPYAIIEESPQSRHSPPTIRLGGLNSLLAMEHSPPNPGPLVSRVPTLIVGMDVSHGSPGRDVASIAAVVGSRQWPLISKYRAAVRSQPAKSEMIDGLFKPVSATEDQGIFRELLEDFYRSSKHKKPDQIIIFRDGVSESQFNQVLNVELEQIIEACKFLDEEWNPKFLLAVAQKKHHTKIFNADITVNVPPGTVIDNGICHPRNNDFYMCAQTHAGMIGPTRPTHYHVLHDELRYSPDDFQEFVHSLSYMYQRSTTATSVVAPICYAHLAAAQEHDDLANFFPLNLEGGWNLNGFNVNTGMPVEPICETAEAFNIKVFNAYTQDLRDLMERNWPNRHAPASIKRYCDFGTSEWERHGVNLYKEAETYFFYTSLAAHDLFNAHGQDFGIGRLIANNNQRIPYHPLTAAQVSQHLRGVLGVEVLLVGESIWDDNGILFGYYISEVRIFYDRWLEIMINALNHSREG